MERSVKPTIKQLEFLHDVLYEQASLILKAHNPCKFRSGGRCFGSSKNGCCGSCKYLDPRKGCTVECLSCKLHLCQTVIWHSKEGHAANQKLSALKWIAYEHGIAGVRESKEEVFKGIRARRRKIKRELEGKQ